MAPLAEVVWLGTPAGVPRTEARDRLEDFAERWPLALQGAYIRVELWVLNGADHRAMARSRLRHPLAAIHASNWIPLLLHAAVNLLAYRSSGSNINRKQTHGEGCGRRLTVQVVPPRHATVHASETKAVSLPSLSRVSVALPLSLSRPPSLALSLALRCPRA